MRQAMQRRYQARLRPTLPRKYHRHAGHLGMKVDAFLSEVFKDVVQAIGLVPVMLVKLGGHERQARPKLGSVPVDRVTHGLERRDC